MFLLRGTLLIALLLGALLGPAMPAAACACQEALVSSGDDGLITGLQFSTGLLILCPLLLVSFFAWRLVRSTQKVARMQAGLAAGPRPENL